MPIGVYVLGTQSFVETIKKALPEDKNTNFVSSLTFSKDLEKLCSQMDTFVIIQIIQNKGYLNQVVHAINDYSRFGNKIAIYLFSEAPSLHEGINLIKEGADDYLHYPNDLIKLGDLISSKTLEWKQLQSKNSTVDSPNFGIHGNSTQIQSIIHQIKKLRSYKSMNVLITGATGTGKELVARAIHNASHGRSSPFVEVNVSAIPDSLVESELFGHEKGAFTGAYSRKRGLFEAAQGGTLFLDEIGEFGLHLQSKLLRALERKTIHRVGSTEDIPVATRIIAATNKDLAEAVQKGQFRQDLFFRLTVVCVHLPPLSERGEDAVLLADIFLRDFCYRFTLTIPGFTSGAKQLLLEYPWPGNIRELRHAIERAAIAAENKPITKSILQKSLVATRELENTDAFPDSDITLKLPPHGAPLNEIVNNAIRVTLKLFNGNKRKAARVLGISPPSLYRRIDEMTKKNVSIDPTKRKSL